MTTKEQLTEADSLFDSSKFEELVNLLKSLDQNDVEVQWRLSRALYECSKLSTNSSKKPELIQEAFKTIELALSNDENHYAVHQWYAIVLDAKATQDGTKARVKALEDIEKHMKKAVELNPQDPTSHYILGEFAYQIASLSWIERKIVNSMLSAPPQCSYEQALDHFLKAEEIQAGFYNMNKLMIGKCYMAMKSNEKAKIYLTEASEVCVVSEDDKKCKEEGAKLLAQVK